MGFEMSTLLKRKIGSLSAGRVQSVTLKLISEREKEIQKFVPEEYWTIQGVFNENIEVKLPAKAASIPPKAATCKIFKSNGLSKA